MKPHNSNTTTTELLTAQENREIAEHVKINNYTIEHNDLLNKINQAAKNGQTTIAVGYTPNEVQIPQLCGFLMVNTSVIPQRILEYKRELENKNYIVTIKLNEILNHITFTVEW